MKLSDDLFADDERYPPWPVASRSVAYFGPEISAAITAIGTLLGGTAATVGAVDAVTRKDPELPKFPTPQKQITLPGPDKTKQAQEKRRRQLAGRSGRTSTLLGGTRQPLGA